jgi:hypothetical protein
MVVSMQPPPPTDTIRLGIELLNAYLERGNDIDAGQYIANRLTESTTDPGAPTHEHYTSGLLFLAELLALSLAKAQGATTDSEIRNGARQILAQLSAGLPPAPDQR